MTDQPQAPKKTPYPNRTKDSMRRMPMSRESKFVGYLVLGFGVLAVATVLLLAFNMKSSKAPLPETAAKEKPVKPAELQKVLVQQSEPKVAQKPKAEVKEEYFNRNPKLDVAKMEGDWQAMVGEYTAVLQIRRDVYQIILASPNPDAPRYYSSGVYKTIEDIIVLEPRTKWPKPVVPNGANIDYKILTRGRFPMVVGFSGSDMLWQNILPEERRVTAPRISPIFLTEKVRHIVWQKID